MAGSIWQRRIAVDASGDATVSGTTPRLTIGDAGEEDTMLVFDGNAQDYRIGLDDGTDTLEMGVGTAHGTTTAMVIDSSANVEARVKLSLGEAVSLDISTPLLPTTDHTATGLTAQMLAGGTIAAFQTVCIHTTVDEVVISDSNAIATMPVIGIAPAAIADTNTGTILLQGFIRDDTWGWTLGGILYASETAGAMTQTAPTTSGALVQAVGIALSADVVYFNPSLTLVEVA